MGTAVSNSGWRIIVPLLIFFLTAWPAAADDVPDTLTAAEVVKRLEEMKAIIVHRAAELDALYSYGKAPETLDRVFHDQGVSDETRNLYASSWGGNGFASYYEAARKYVFEYHLSALDASISKFKGYLSSHTVPTARLDGLAVQVRHWSVYETGFKALLDKRLRLFVEAAHARDAVFLAANIVCDGVEACETAKKAARDAAEAEARRVDAALEANRLELAEVNARFFSELSESIPPDCVSVSLKYKTLAGFDDRTRYPVVLYEPADCVPPQPQAFRIVRSEGPQFELSSHGIIQIKGMAGGFADIEVSARTKAGVLLHGEDRVSIAADTRCRSLLWGPATHVYAFRYHEDAMVSVRFMPPDCARSEEGVAITSGDPRILWLEGGAATQRRAYGVEVGKTTIIATATGLPTLSEEVAVEFDGPDCTGISMQYDPATIRSGQQRLPRLGTGLAPILTYTPKNCRHPEINPKFSSSDTRFLVVLNESTGALQGVRAGKATITLDHAGLTASSEIAVLDRPGCNRVDLRYDREVLAPGETAEAATNYSFVEAGGGTEERDCIMPQTFQTFASSNAEVARVDAATGQLKAVAVGPPVIISITADGVEPDSVEVEVRAREE